MLSGPTDRAGFGRAVRWALARELPPDAIAWRDAPGAGLFDGDEVAAADLPDAPALRLPAPLVELVGAVVPHDDPSRFDRLYRLVRRTAADRRAWSDPLDPDRRALEAMAAAVRREIHRMHAFVRFRRVEDASLPDGERWVAWFEPAHHVVEAVGPFFRDRFTAMDWAILTPRGSLAWDRRTLRHGPPADPRDAPAADAGEALWLAYYRSIFNPARVNVAAMKAEMPVRFWRHLPEAAQIPRLVAQAAPRTVAMIEAPPSVRTRRRGAAATVRAAADAGASTTPGGAGGSEGSDGAGGADAAARADGAGEAGRACGAGASDAAADASPLARAVALEALARRAAGCDACPIGACATQTVWGEGPVDAPLMWVGEQPGDREDLEGRPFVGPAGQLLQRAFDALGLDRGAAYLTNAVKHFAYEPRGKRRLHKTASQREAEACAPWLDAEIALVRPRAAVALGATAARALLGAPVSVVEREGEWIPRPDGLPVLVLRHPAALLRAPEATRDAQIERWIARMGRARAALDGPAS
ncbi:MAG TPA: UdgX family uracil-DNA binding protein [Burkholderiaceae bacterium]|nr:UdgX family uracil-DNA binding protein [Burkholderiaceae bacterium]